MPNIVRENAIILNSLEWHVGELTLSGKANTAHIYPPNMQTKTTQTILKQAEFLARGLGRVSINYIRENLQNFGFRFV